MKRGQFWATLAIPVTTCIGFLWSTFLPSHPVPSAVAVAFGSIVSAALSFLPEPPAPKE